MKPTEYATLGWCVFPVAQGSKSPPKGLHWREVSTSDPAAVAALFDAYSPCNIGLDCGKSGLVVLDLDVRGGKDGLAIWKKIAQKAGISPRPAAVARTPSGGLHLFFKAKGFQLAGKIYHQWSELGVDVQAKGRYVILPPSLHPNGGRYTWLNGHGGGEAAEAPPSLLDVLSNGPSALEDGDSPSEAAPRAGEVTGTDSLEGTKEGKRNNSLTRLAGAMRRQGANRDAIIQALLAQNAKFSPPLDRAEVLKIVDSIMNYRPFQYTGASPCTDVANSRRLAAMHSDILKYCKSLGGWLWWDGKRWVAAEAKAFELAKGLGKQVLLEALQEPDEKVRAEMARWAARSEEERRVRAALSLAASDPAIVAEPGDFDNRIFELNLQNGVLNLNEGKLYKHHQKFRHTFISGAAWEPGVDWRGGEWERFLRTTLPDEEVRGFVQRAVGSALPGRQVEQKLFMLWGGGANGKSTFLRAISEALGDYATTLEARELVATKNPRQGGPTEALARLKGKRLVSTVEVEEGQHLAEGLVKQLTGEPTITARYAYGHLMTFPVTFTIFLAANHKPDVKGRDWAIWRRIVLIPFEHEIPEEDQDPLYYEHFLKDNLNEVLAWAVEGHQLWVQEGCKLRPPRVVVAAVAEYKRSTDPLTSFFEEYCVIAPHQVEGAQALYDAYAQWVKEEGLARRYIKGRNKFYRAMEERGFEKKRDCTLDVYVFEGIGLKPEVRKRVESERVLDEGLARLSKMAKEKGG